MRLSPRRSLTFLLTVCMLVILYLNILSFFDHQQQVASLYSLQGRLDTDLTPTERCVLRGGEVLCVEANRFSDLALALDQGRFLGYDLQQQQHQQQQQRMAGIRTVKLHAGLDTARILLDAKEGIYRTSGPPAAAARKFAATTGPPSFREIAFPSPRSAHGRHRSIWPDPARPYDDRILDQIMFVPESIKRARRKQERSRSAPAATSSTVEMLDENNTLASRPFLKTILMWSGLSDRRSGRSRFIDDKCLVDTCYVTDNAAVADRADAVIFNFDPVYYTWSRPAHQIWILWMLESPMHTATLHDLQDRINWTATYRWDSTIVTPYEKFVRYKDTPELPAAVPPDVNYAEHKTKKVAWFVSNCGARNRRLEYADELSKFIQVDVYGVCGPYKCSRIDQDACLDILRRDYKFYLAFENSNCDYYITEKFFWNGLKADVIPIVMGARKKDYLAAAPPFSYIHVEDFSSPRELASYLHRLDANDTLYNQYFRWKTMGEFINTKFWCRLCAMLHDEHMPQHHYPNIEQWWRPNGICTLDRWDNHNDHINDWKKYVYSNL